MKKILISFSFVCITGTAFPRVAQITFQEMMERCSYIAVGRFDGVYDSLQTNPFNTSTYSMQATEIIYGDQTRGRISFFEWWGGLYRKEGRTIVAFINQNNGLEWYAIPLDPTVTEINDSTILFVEGIYETDGYYVTPQLITLAQVKEYVKNQKFIQRVCGYTYFFSDKLKRFEKSKLFVDLSYTVSKDSTWGEAKLNGFKCKVPGTQVTLNSYWVFYFENYISFYFRPHLWNGATFSGEVKSTSYTKDYWETNFICGTQFTFEDFKRKMNDTTLGTPYYELRLVVSGKTYPVYYPYLGEYRDRAWTRDAIRKKTGNENALFIEENEGVYTIGDFSKLEWKAVLNMDDYTGVETGNYNFDVVGLKCRVRPVTGKLFDKTKDGDSLIGDCTLYFEKMHFSNYHLPHW